MGADRRDPAVNSDVQPDVQPDAAVRVLVVDDDAMVRDGFAAIIGSQDDLIVVGTAADGVDAIAAARELRPDVVVMDVRMPALDGIEATRRLLGLPAPPRVLVVTTFEHDSYVYDALLAGASGFLLKRAGAEQLLLAVRTLARTDAVLFPAAIRDLVAARRTRRALPQLTAREQEVLRLLATGLSNAEIAAELVVGAETVKSHVTALLAKLGVRDRTQAVIAAYESGFVG
ncbi:response regulator transcription factor [Flexivirga sp. ID2601S]|uniref:Response regulator transcription factor n=1 Tax=Flexivirga aerilata TaxID=1656889 RepID=A0A849AJZ2_9MICO|nr:response regulator transcription factor [Flexivirga aerilata]NNG40343.1 response regulator transcription factor [Flexivirga aerilata]